MGGDIMHIPPKQFAVQGFPVNRFYTKAESDAKFAPKTGGTGITSINGDTAAAQTIVTASTGTDFTIATTGGVTTIAIPTASASNRGLLSSADWTTFNNKGSGTVTSVSGTTNRITVATGTTTPVIDISASYIGQSSITTVGTLVAGSIPYSLLTGTPTIPTGANPTGTIGLTAVNGSASTFLRSDGAPALSQAIAPTWTGVHTFTPAARSSGVAAYLTINAPADTGITTATESKGINIVGSTRTWADGTVTTQREYFFGKPTYNKTTTAATFTNLATLVVEGAPVAGTGVTMTHPWSLWVQGGNSHFGSQIGYTQSAVTGTGAEFNDTNNTTGGQIVSVQNTSNGTSAFTGFNCGNNQSVDGGATSHFFGIYFNSSTYTDTTFGTANAIASLGAMQNTDGPISLIASAASQYVNVVIAGSATTNEVARFNTTFMTLGLAGTLTGELRMAGATSNYIAIKGVAAGGSTTNTLQAVTDTFVYRATTDTLTNKRVQPRVVSASSYTTDTGTSLDVSTCDLFIVTAQAGALKFNNPSGTPVQGEKLMIRIKDNGTARALTYDTQFRASSDLALPTTTVLSKTLYMGFVYNSTDTKWDLIAVLNNF